VTRFGEACGTGDTTMTTRTAPDAHGEIGAPFAEPSYAAVFIYLAVLIGAELGVYAMSPPIVLKAGLLVALAIANVTLAAMYFMHLAVERGGLWLIAVTPVVLAAILYLTLRPDVSARRWAHEPANNPIGMRQATAYSAGGRDASLTPPAPADSNGRASAMNH
jgi:cytochrome c oxidase subunit IV